jgi:hypothetical protein
LEDDDLDDEEATEDREGFPSRRERLSMALIASTRDAFDKDINDSQSKSRPSFLLERRSRFAIAFLNLLRMRSTAVFARAGSTLAPLTKVGR